MSKKYVLAVLTLVGTITGAGLFTMPFIITKAGLIPFLIFFPFLTVAQCLIHLAYAKVILATKDAHRIPGYVELYAGKKWKNVVALFCILAGFGSILAYIILGGSFLQNLLGGYFGGNLVIYSSILFALEALIVFAGLKLMVRAESFLTAILILLFLSISAVCFFHMKGVNFSLINWGSFLLPYGPIFFAISGDAAIPEVCKILTKEKEKIKGAIIWGTTISAILMAAFAITVAGVTGGNTSPEALAGLSKYFGNGLITSALIFGLLCIITSCLVYLQSVKEIFWWDFKLNKKLSLILAAVGPFAIFLFGLRNITTVVSLNGLITGSILGLILVSLAIKVEKKFPKKGSFNFGISRELAIFLVASFVIALLSELVSLIF